MDVHIFSIFMPHLCGIMGALKILRNEILSVSPTKPFSCVQISADALTAGDTYTVSCANGASTEITVDGMAVWSGRNGMR